MKITALGVSSAYPKAGGACSGWLVRQDDANLLVDCGTGVLSNLQKIIPFQAVTAIIITHLHADHFLDLVPFRFALKYGLPPEQRSRPLLYLPPDGCGKLDEFAEHFDSSDSLGFFSSIFNVQEYQANVPFHVRALLVETAPVVHYVPAFAVAICTDKKVVFSGDTGPCEELVKFAEGADLMICEATDSREEVSQVGLRGHLTPEEAGDAARRAGVKRLLITHLWPHRDMDKVLSLTVQSFGPNAELAEEGKSYIL